MAAIGGILGGLHRGWEEAEPRDLAPGLHPIRTGREAWNKLLLSFVDEGWKLVLLSPDPPPSGGGGGDAPEVDRFWFRGSPRKGSVLAYAADLRRRLPRLALKGAVTGVEGIEVLLFWNSTAEVVALLDELDGRLLEVGSPGLMLLRPGLLTEAEADALAPERTVTPPRRQRVGRR